MNMNCDRKISLVKWASGVHFMIEFFAYIQIWWKWHLPVILFLAISNNHDVKISHVATAELSWIEKFCNNNLTKIWMKAK